MRRDFAQAYLNATQPPSTTAQQRAAREALAVLKGEAPRSSLRGPARELFETLSESQLSRLLDARVSGPVRRAGTSGNAAPAVRLSR
jgi:hypothetical protein